VHVWHHIPGWFEQARNLLTALQSLGGTVVELSNAYAAAQEAWQRRTWEHDQTDRLSARLLNLALSAEALASESMEQDPGSGVLRTLVQTIREMQERLATFLDMREVRETAPVSQSLDTLVDEAVKEANDRYGEELFSVIKREQVPTLQLRMEMMRRAIDELLKNAKSHVAPDEKVLVELMYDAQQDAVVLDVQNPGYGVPAERKERIFGMGSGLLLAKAAAETHGGTLEEIGEPGATAVFRMVLPTRQA
jgi:signal transduction histidine kinase